jgi:hypothetical protein
VQCRRFAAGGRTDSAVSRAAASRQWNRTSPASISTGIAPTSSKSCASDLLARSTWPTR